MTIQPTPEKPKEQSAAPVGVLTRVQVLNLIAAANASREAVRAIH